jgi:predicted O-methyltransferase YrrM
LVTKCFYDKTKYTEYQFIKDYRKSVLADKNYIQVKDFGAGSRVFKSNKRQISQIAKTAGISQKRAELLFRIMQYFKPTTVLEIGTSLGLATVALSLGNKNAKITSLEGCPETIQIAESRLQMAGFSTQISEKRFQRKDFEEQISEKRSKIGNKSWQKADCENVELINTEFSAFLNNHQLKSTIYNLIYIDGNHSKQATLDYFELLLPTISNDSVWIFDDIYWNKDMLCAWEIIKNHSKVTVTIDTFQWGIVFFRTEQVKEHFVVRI